jgi:hypothetical protein
MEVVRTEEDVEEVQLTIGARSGDDIGARRGETDGLIERNDELAPLCFVLPTGERHHHH